MKLTKSKKRKNAANIHKGLDHSYRNFQRNHPGENETNEIENKKRRKHTLKNDFDQECPNTGERSKARENDNKQVVQVRFIDVSTETDC